MNPSARPILTALTLALARSPWEPFTQARAGRSNCRDRQI